MTKNASFFAGAKPVAYRWYKPDRKVLGRRMEDQLRIAVCYWHSLVWTGTDPFGGETFMRPWHRPGDAMKQARLKADVAFDLFERLGNRYFTFHDLDLAPEGATLRETNRNVRLMGDVIARKMSRGRVKVLWGMANLTSHRRYMSGAATNPDPEVFAYAAAQSKNALELTHDLGGENYALWGGREGYETLLNTDLSREMQQLARFLSLIVEHKHKIGFKGPILIETKPAEPTKHQYDADVAAVHGFLARHGLEKHILVNIEQNHALHAGHSFEHEIAMAAALGVLGSLDMNRGDELLGWDTAQFANNLPQMALAMYHVFRNGGLGSGGLNLDARVRRQSIDPQDLVTAHADAIDLCARASLVAEKMVASGELATHVDSRYAGWNGKLGRDILAGKVSLAKLARNVEERDLEPQPRSGQQELLESIVNRYL